MGEEVPSGKRPGEIEHDVRESPFVLPPVEGAPFPDARAKTNAVLRIIEQSERERASP